jgi:hypothetical protein
MSYNEIAMKCPTHVLLLATVLALPAFGQAQFFEVHTDTIQYFEHPIELKFLEALESEQITYTKLGKGDVQYNIDLDNRKMVMIPNAGEESYSFEITEVFSTGEDVLTSFECKDESGFLGVILLYKSEYEGVNMLVEYKVSDTVTEGYMCFDMTVVE